MTTLTIKPVGYNFKRGVAYAKKIGARFDGAEKVWTLPATDNAQANVKFGIECDIIMLVEGATVDSRRHDHNCDARFGGACECQEA